MGCEIEILERKEGERMWNDITKEYIHELPEFEKNKEWEKLQREKERKVYDEYSPPKQARESDKQEDEEKENEKEEEKKKKTPEKKENEKLEDKKRKERTPEGNDSKAQKV